MTWQQRHTSEVIVPLPLSKIASENYIREIWCQFDSSGSGERGVVGWGVDWITVSESKNKQIDNVSRCTLQPEVALTSLRDVLWKYLVKVSGTCPTTFECPPRMIYQSWNASRICPNLPHIMQAELISAGMRRVLTKILACWSSIFIPPFIIPNIIIYIRISFYSPLLSL